MPVQGLKLEALPLIALVWATPAVGLCQTQPQAPVGTISPIGPVHQRLQPFSPQPRALTPEERLRLIERLRPRFTLDQSVLLPSLSDSNLLDMNQAMRVEPGAPVVGGSAPGGISSAMAAPGGSPYGAGLRPITIVRIHNPSPQAVTLRLEYGTMFCAKESLTLLSGAALNHRLCKPSAKVVFDGNPGTVAPAQIGARPCYLVGRFDNPPRWALDACPQ